MSIRPITPAQSKSNLHNVVGTFAIEGITISQDTRSTLDRIGTGQASYQQTVNKLRTKYAKKGQTGSGNLYQIYSNFQI